MVKMVTPHKEVLSTMRDRFTYHPTSGLITVNYTHGFSANKRVEGSAVGTVRKDGYMSFMLDNRRYLLHRVAWYLHHGTWPDKIIDHRDGDPKNNRIDNLRLVTDGQNSKSYWSVRKGASSKFRGVIKCKDRVGYSVNICCDGVKSFLGTHPSEFEAAMIWNIKATELGFAPEAMNKVFEDV